MAAALPQGQPVVVLGQALLLAAVTVDKDGLRGTALAAVEQEAILGLAEQAVFIKMLVLALVAAAAVARAVGFMATKFLAAAGII